MKIQTISKIERLSKRLQEVTHNIVLLHYNDHLHRIYKDVFIEAFGHSNFILVVFTSNVELVNYVELYKYFFDLEYLIYYNTDSKDTIYFIEK